MRPINRINRFFLLIGFDGDKFFHFLKYLPYFFKSYREFNALLKNSDNAFYPIQLYPILLDIDRQAGTAYGEYFYQDLWAARKIFSNRPVSHIDIGSRIDGFISHILTFMPVTVIDIRPLKSSISGLTFIQSDATYLSEFSDNSIESLSSLHAIEHFGLGRYGDPIDPQACFKAMRTLARILKPGGKLYFSVPIGREHIRFNANYVFAPDTILDIFKNLELQSFSVIDETGEFKENVNPYDYNNVKMVCGLFEFFKHI
jgi:hypothetical protein